MTDQRPEVFHYFKRYGFNTHASVVGGGILLSNVSGYKRLENGTVEVTMKNSEWTHLLDKEDVDKFLAAWGEALAKE